MATEGEVVPGVTQGAGVARLAEDEDPILVPVLPLLEITSLIPDLVLHLQGDHHLLPGTGLGLL